MRHLDLFSGIGGFALAVDRVWPGSEHTFCDNDPFCQQVLKKHWPNSKIYGDIRTLTYPAGGDAGRNPGELPPAHEQQTEKRSERRYAELSGADRQFDVITGGFPCQPFSNAGLRRGTEDNRYLWPEMFRVIQDFKPTWVVAENVSGLVTWNEGLVLEQVRFDLESEGYEAQPFIIPAVAVNAPHQRKRIWIIAYREGFGREERRSEQQGWQRQPSSVIDNSFVTNARRVQRRQGSGERIQPKGKISKLSNSQFFNESWELDWIEIATELCGMDDGLPAELDGLKFSKSQHRNERLKALGNAIVPQVAEEIFKTIKQSDLLQN